jgi:T5SS/PEP-CTERM-associated repeat protein/autotransporter-associated beta strand protein
LLGHDAFTGILTATVSGANSLWSTDFANISSDATLTVSNGGRFNAAPSQDWGLYGEALLVGGTLNIGGSGSTVNVSDRISVYSSGSGQVNLRAGATLTTRHGTLGDTYKGSGTASVTIDGLDSTWQNSGELLIGGDPSQLAAASGSSGLITITNGGVLSSGSAVLGQLAGTSGTVVLTGMAYPRNSQWINDGDLRVGAAGTGSIAVSAGGWLRTNTTTLGEQAGSSGVVSVLGAQSHWTNSADLIVGSAGTGTVDIGQGAELTTFRGHIGFLAGSHGQVSVDGAGSSWRAAGSMFIGNAGSGELIVANGGRASTAGNAYLGVNAGAYGSALVTGAGSTWNINTAGTTLAIGGSLTAAGGTGVLSIGDGAVVNAPNTRIYDTGSLFLRNGGTLNGDIAVSGGQIVGIGGNTLAGQLTLLDGGVRVVMAGSTSVLTLAGNLAGTGGLIARANPRGTGTLVLAGNNRYTGLTTIDAGTLQVDGSSISTTLINAGALTGHGRIDAAVTIGNGLGSADALLAAGDASGPLTVGDLSIAADGRFVYTLDVAAGGGWGLAVNGGVHLDPAASFLLIDRATGIAAPGSSFVMIANDGVDAIDGQFANLPEGYRYTLGGQTYSVSYFGGTGNDLTLSALPVPEPGNSALWLAGIALLAAAGRLRRSVDPLAT